MAHATFKKCGIICLWKNWAIFKTFELLRLNSGMSTFIRSTSAENAKKEFYVNIELDQYFIISFSYLEFFFRTLREKSEVILQIILTDIDGWPTIKDAGKDYLLFNNLIQRKIELSQMS